MSTSLARIEANRRNAQHSTGPTSVEGKARSRLNAFQHGRAGAGDLLAPNENETLVARRTEAFAAEFRAAGEAGGFLARRAAILSVRMDQAQVDAEAGMLAHVQAAVEAFDATRVGELDRLENLLSRRMAMHEARVSLEAMPEGIERLLQFWERERLAIAEPTPDPDRRQRLGSLLGLTAEAAANITAAELADRIETEQTRLGAVDSATRADQVTEIQWARAEAGRAARLDPSGQVHLIRRYDAAAERGFYRAVRAIGDLNRAHAAATKAEAASRPAPPPRPAPVPPGKPAPVPVKSARPLGSFRPDINVVAAPLVAALPTEDSTRFCPEPRPKKRRDVRQPKTRRR